MNRKIIKIISLSTILVGLSILLYPFISNYQNSKVQSKAIANYDKMLQELDKKDYNQLFEKANNYNQKLSTLDFPLTQYKKLSNYNKLININNNGMIGYITINKIKVELPIYHGTSSSVLNTAVGHLQGSSLPIGGPSTHSILSAHRGLPSASLFSNLNKLELGDIFTITVLDRKLTYQVDQIIVVEPSDISKLKIIKEKDYITLLTCTPYGINTHRLLVRGIRIDNIEEIKLTIKSEAYKIDKLIVTITIAIPILLIIVIYVLIKPSKKKFNYKEEL